MVGGGRGPVAQNAGPVPFRLSIGVTGHRHLPETTNWPERIAEALNLIRERLAPAGDTPIAWLVISPLAEGADRLVAEAILARPGSRLEVPLPLPRDEYMTDFKSGESKAAFNELLERASVTIQAPRFESREEAYEWAGEAMVGRSDIVIAVWDGLPSRGVGGTADIVELARRYGRPVVHIPTGSDPEIQVLDALAEDGPSPSAVTGDRVSGSNARPPERVSHTDPFTHLRRALRGMEDYNRIAVDASRLATASEQARADLMEGITTPEGRTIWEPIASWLIPHYVKADLLAKDARSKVNWLLAVTFTFPVLAIVTVAAQSQFLPNIPTLLWIEVGLLVIVLVVVSLDRISQFRPDRAGKRIWRRLLPRSAQQQWVSCRHLAERLRSAFFLAAVELPPAGGAAEEYSGMGAADLQPFQVDASPIQGFHESAEGWLPRLYVEIWSERPPAHVAHSDLPAVRQVLAEQWIRSQETYHFNAARRNRRDDRIAAASVTFVFIATAVIAGLHAIGVGAGSPDTEKTLTLIAIVFPALAAVATTLTHHFEFRRHREASESMRRRLRHAGDVMARAPTLDELRREAEATERLMMTENRDWFALMRLHQVELHA